MKRKIMLVEPSEIIYNGLKKIIDETHNYDLSSHLDDIVNMEEKLASSHPDIVIINPTLLPYSKRASLILNLADNDSTATVALVYQYIEPAHLKHFDAIIDIRNSKSTIVSTLDSLEEIHKHSKANADAYELTNRETDILVLVAKGLMSKEIAEELNISIHTVISHRKNITRKTGIKSVAGLAVYAMLNNLMDESAIDSIE